MMRKTKEESRSRLRHRERSMATAIDLALVADGEVFVRQGTPCMKLSESSLPNDDNTKVWIVNLTNGSAWPASARDQVHLAYDVQLTFETARKD